jgi:hypothetical protein
MVRTLRWLFFGNSFAGWHLGLLWLLLLLLLMRSLELQKCHPLWYTYCMDAQDKFHVCIRMNAVCLVNANMNCGNSITLYSDHLTKRANLFYGREVLTKSTQPNV